MSKLIHFLLMFDHDTGTLICEEPYLDGDEAVAAYTAKEREVEEHHKERRIEVVLIGSDSIETIRQTHANYFDGSVTVSKYLAGI